MSLSVRTGFRKWATVPLDCEVLAELFYNTVHTVNAKDYTKEQLDVWATGIVDLEKWNQSFEEHYSLVAIDDEVIVGSFSLVFALMGKLQGKVFPILFFIF